MVEDTSILNQVSVIAIATLSKESDDSKTCRSTILLRKLPAFRSRHLGYVLWLSNVTEISVYDICRLQTADHRLQIVN